MAGDQQFAVTVRGLDDVAAALRSLPAKLRARALLNALRAGGRVFRDEARRLTPVLQVPVRRKGRLYRKPGTVRDAIVVRTSKRARRAGDLGVFVNVRPAKGANRGAANPFDPFYWRWLNFGRKGRAGEAPRKAVPGIGLLGAKAIRARRGIRPVGPMAGARFLEGALAKTEQALQRIQAVLGPAIQRLARKETP